MKFFNTSAMLAAVILLGACLPTSGAEVHKCVAADGQTSYTDTLCSPNARSSITVTPPAKAATSFKASSVGVPPPVKIGFPGVDSTDLIKASAIMDNIQLIGRDCEWALKVDPRQAQRCTDFLEKLQPGGEFQQISERAIGISKNPKSLSDNTPEIRRLRDHMENVVRSKEFMFSNLGVKSQ